MGCHRVLLLLLSFFCIIVEPRALFRKYSKELKDIEGDVIGTCPGLKLTSCFAICDVNCDAARFENEVCNIYKDVVVLATEYAGTGIT